MKTFVQYGAGNIGRGFIGELFSQGGYKVKFIDVNMEVIDALNSKRKYPVTIVDGDIKEDIWVENVSGIDGRNGDEVSKAIADADVMATAVGVNVIPYIVDFIAKGITLRAKNKVDKPLDIIICENMLDADKFLQNLILQRLDESIRDYFLQKIGFVEASIGRMVPVMTKEQKKENNLRVYVEKYAQLPVDKDAFKGEVPKIPGIFPYSPFGFYIKRKLYVHNMGHALTTYLGNILKLDYVWESVANPFVKLIAQRAMQESAIALSNEYNFPLSSLLDHIDDLLLRFSNVALGDTIKRVGNDINRKLSFEDRFVGAINNCLKNDIVPIYIPIGIAAGLYFNFPEDKNSSSLIADIKNKGVEYVLENHCKLPKDSLTTRMILDYYNCIQNSSDFSNVLKLAEKYQAKIHSNKRII